MKKTDFYINMAPTSISFDCPHCGLHVSLNWSCVDVPEYLGDDWGEVGCPYCEKTIQLGDYDI